MKHLIDPTVDCVFKALLGSEENKNLLIHFLNAVTEPAEEKKIVSVELLNPYNEKEFYSDKLSIVDVKAKDAGGRLFQVEIQMVVLPALKERILYGWSDLYASQLKEGQDYKELRPVISVWLVCETVFYESEGCHHHFQIYDADYEFCLNTECSIHVLELTKFRQDNIINEIDRWMLFFRDGKHIDDEHLPEFMKTKEMMQAMNTLAAFSEKEKAYHLYQSRMNYIRWQKTIQREIQERDAALQQRDAALQQKDAALQQRDAALQQKDAALQQKDAALQQKDAALQQKDATLQQKNAALQKKDAVLREKDAALREMEQEKESARKKEQLLLEKIRELEERQQRR